MRKLLLLLICCLWLGTVSSSAQKLSVSTNMIDYACLGTLNFETSYAVAQHWSLTASARYNPFTYHLGDASRQFQYRQQSYALGARFWVWHSFSGWWVSGKARYQEFNNGGIFSRLTQEGDRIGCSMSAGYTYMISKHFNIEFGLGLWSGMSWFKKYSCPLCGLTVQSGRKWFVLPDDVMISLAYVF